MGSVPVFFLTHVTMAYIGQECSLDMVDCPWDDTLSAFGDSPASSTFFLAESFSCPKMCRPVSKTAQNQAALPSHTTTLMIRNIPMVVAQNELIDELNHCGFKDLYNFCYMPCCFNTGLGRGYAFVNFRSPTIAGSFVGSWHGTRRFDVAATDALNISPAAIQGYDALRKKWSSRSTRIRNPNLKPFISQSLPLPEKEGKQRLL